MIVTGPGVRPHTVPLDSPAVAVAGLLLVHVPPVTRSPSVVQAPTHTVDAPVMPLGDGLTHTVVVLVQPAGEV